MNRTLRFNKSERPCNAGWHDDGSAQLDVGVQRRGSHAAVGRLLFAHSLQVAHGVPSFANTRRCQEAKRLTDRHAPVLEQRVLASLIDSGAYERHVRRIGRENERRRATLLEAIARWMPDATQVEGSAAGLHVVVWLPWLPAHEEPAVVEAARRRGVGVHAVSGLFAAAGKRRQSASAGFVVGYASLGVTEIERGVRGWSAALSDLQSQGVSSRRSMPDPIE